MDETVETWLDREHYLRTRAEKAAQLLRDLWGELPPPSPDPQIGLLVDGLAGDDEHGRQARLVVHGDGLAYDQLERILRDTHAPAHAAGLLPPGLRERLTSLSHPPASTPAPTPAPAPAPTPAGQARADVTPTITPTVTPTAAHTAAHTAARTIDVREAERSWAGMAALPDTRCGIWELDPATRTVTYDAICAQLLGAGDQPGRAPLPVTLPDHLRAPRTAEAADSPAPHPPGPTTRPSAVHPDDRELISAALEETLRTGRHYETRFRVLLPDGTYAWRASRARVLPANDHAPAHLIGFIAAED